MVADVSYWVRIMNQRQWAMNDPKSTALITRDLLGGAGAGACDLHSSKELDLDLHVPSGFEKRLDLKSGKVYLQRCKSSEQSTSETISKLQDLNFPPAAAAAASKKPLNLFDDTKLDLKLVPQSYQSVCTLDKVKYALERAEKETIKKRPSVSMSTSNSSSSVKETDDDEERSYAAGCPSCLLYVLISTSNPKCPRCNMTVPSPSAVKKARIDLNISI